MNLYLSPHYDDICFSLGHYARNQGGCIVNIFTAGDHVGAPLPLPVDRAERIAFVSDLRRREDEAFARAAGLERADLGLPEPSLLGLSPFDCSHLGPDVARISQRIVPFLLDRLPAAGDPRSSTIYCPMGIGGHRDHVATLVSLRGAFDRLSARCTLVLYEDLHYASLRPAREAGLRRAAELFAGYELSSTAYFMDADDAARKMTLIGLYASQHPHPPQPRQYTPASGLSAEPHEIVWRVDAPK
ncbi:MAG: hypothetical protein E7774_03645 [Bradyrhizobium sp.]|nr:MAG: hypothetical protein E7774_03645 [Bradyrhizobium sp.]